MTRRKTSVSVATIVVASTAIAQISLVPGRYEVTVEMQLPQAPAPMTFNNTDCITAEDAQDIAALMTKEIAASDEDCEISNLEVTSTKIAFDSMCTVGGAPATGHADITFGADSWDGVMTTQMGAGATLAAKMSGKRVGECTGDEDEE